MGMRRRLGTVMVREIEQEVLLLDPASGQIHQLNLTAGFIWRKCDETSAEEIAAQLAIEFEVEGDSAFKDVVETLGKLKRLNLIQDV